MKITRPSSIVNFQESLLRVREYLFNTNVWLMWAWRQAKGKQWSKAIQHCHQQMVDEIFWFECQGIQFEPPEAQPFMVDGQHRIAAMMELMKEKGWVVKA